MSEPEIATKAPESDAAEDSHALGDTPAQTGASMGVYITKPSDYPHSPSKLLLLLTSGTGIHSVNNQLQADKFAGEGFLVVMPDQFAGDPAPSSGTGPQTYESHNPSLIEQVKLRAAETAKSFVLDMWLARHTPEKVMPLLQNVIEGAKEEFADAVASGDGLYAAGYCFGAKYVLLLAGERSDAAMWGQAPKDEEEGLVSSGPLIKAGAIAHGTLIMREDFETLKSPVTIACVEDDSLFPDALREECRQLLESRKTEHEIKVYSNVPHGFAVLGEYNDQKIQDAQASAYDQMLSWLQNH
ncbi:MAG: hypothetical protein M1819_001008 [Sarea resinae]|nr:MAG: hypothetical protein M1819_001008 [Sarea resinae]